MTGTAGGEFVRTRGHGSLPVLIPIPHPAAPTTGSARSARSTTTTGTYPTSRLL